VTTTFLIGALIAGAGSQGVSYGESLLDSTHARHPALTSVQIEVTDGQRRFTAITRAWGGRARSRDTQTLSDANGNQIGKVTIVTRCANPTRSSAIAAEISRRIYSSASLSESAPFVAGAALAPSAQALIEDAINRDPQLVTLAFHVTPPLAQTNSIVASSFGRIGKLADADDERVMREGATLRELTNGGKRLAIELPLLDARGRTVGALSTSFRIDPKADLESIAKRAVALRDLLASEIPSLKALFRPATASRQVRGLHDCL
jgi:hypothetical protein